MNLIDLLFHRYDATGERAMSVPQRLLESGWKPPAFIKPPTLRYTGDPERFKIKPRGRKRPRNVVRIERKRAQR